MKIQELKRGDIVLLQLPEALLGIVIEVIPKDQYLIIYIKLNQGSPQLIQYDLHKNRCLWHTLHSISVDILKTLSVCKENPLPLLIAYQYLQERSITERFKIISKINGDEL